MAIISAFPLTSCFAIWGRGIFISGWGSVYDVVCHRVSCREVHKKPKPVRADVRCDNEGVVDGEAGDFFLGIVSVSDTDLFGALVGAGVIYGKARFDALKDDAAYGYVFRSVSCHEIRFSSRGPIFLGAFSVLLFSKCRVVGYLSA